MMKDKLVIYNKGYFIQVAYINILTKILDKYLGSQLSAILNFSKTLYLNKWATIKDTDKKFLQA